jgi:hypothetical protein
MEKQTLSKAKADMSKIESFKKKVRESAAGAPITNNLRNLSAENIKNRITKLNDNNMQNPQEVKQVDD